MNKDRVIGATRKLVGAAERKIGDAVGCGPLERSGLVDEVLGAVQSGIGSAKERVAETLKDVPEMTARATAAGRDAARSGDAAIRTQMNRNGPAYVIAGAFALLALGIAAIRRR